MIYTSNWFNIDSEIAIDKLLKIGKYRSFYVIHRNAIYFAFVEPKFVETTSSFNMFSGYTGLP